MTRLLFALLLALLPTRAFAFDYIFTFATAAAAQADANLAPFWNGTSWDLSRVNPIVVSWNPANDTSAACPPPNQASTCVTHSFSPNIWLIIFSPVRNATWEADAGFVVCLDRDGANGGGLPGQYIQKINGAMFPNIGSLMSTLRFQPVFAGSHYPALGVQ